MVGGSCMITFDVWWWFSFLIRGTRASGFRSCYRVILVHSCVSSNNCSAYSWCVRNPCEGIGGVCVCATLVVLQPWDCTTIWLHSPRTIKANRSWLFGSHFCPRTIEGPVIEGPVPMQLRVQFPCNWGSSSHVWWFMLLFLMCTCGYLVLMSTVKVRNFIFTSC